MRRHPIQVLGLVAGLVALQLGCGSSSNPYGPSSGGGSGGTALLHETYDSGSTGSWVAADPTTAQLAVLAGGAQGSADAVEFYSSGSNATTASHFRDTFCTSSSTVTITTPLTTTFYFIPGHLSPTAADPLRVHVQIYSAGVDNVLWYLDIMGNGSSYQFNGSAISGCVYCPPAGSTTWHSVTIKNTGTNTSSLAFDGWPAESGIVHNYAGGVIADVFAPSVLDILHITTGDCISSTNYFALDSLRISTP
jgi:hypothetical protein